MHTLLWNCTGAHCCGVNFANLIEWAWTQSSRQQIRACGGASARVALPREAVLNAVAEAEFAQHSAVGGGALRALLHQGPGPPPPPPHARLPATFCGEATAFPAILS